MFIFSSSVITEFKYFACQYPQKLRGKRCQNVAVVFIADVSISGQQHFRLMLLSGAVIYLIMSMHSWGIAAEQTCRTSRPVPDHALAGHVITCLEGKRLDSCVISCELTQNCFSINYYTALKKCELNKKTAEWYPSDLVSKSGAVYLNMVVRDYTPCVDRNPPCTGKCVPIPGSLATRCVCELRNAACKNDCKLETKFKSLSITSLIQTGPLR